MIVAIGLLAFHVHVLLDYVDVRSLAAAARPASVVRTSTS